MTGGPFGWGRMAYPGNLNYPVSQVYNSFQDRIATNDARQLDSQNIKFGTGPGSPERALMRQRNNLYSQEGNLFGPGPPPAPPVLEPIRRGGGGSRGLAASRAEPGASGTGGNISYSKGYQPPGGGGFAASTPASSVAPSSGSITGAWYNQPSPAAPQYDDVTSGLRWGSAV